MRITRDCDILRNSNLDQSLYKNMLNTATLISVPCFFQKKKPRKKSLPYRSRSRDRSRFTIDEEADPEKEIEMDMRTMITMRKEKKELS